MTSLLNSASILPTLNATEPCIVTEQGTARIWGRDSVEQARQIPNRAARPSPRDGLRAASQELGLPLT